jgi:hypothetical protein
MKVLVLINRDKKTKKKEERDEKQIEVSEETI